MIGKPMDVANLNGRQIRLYSSRVHLRHDKERDKIYIRSSRMSSATFSFSLSPSL